MSGAIASDGSATSNFGVCVVDANKVDPSGSQPVPAYVRLSISLFVLEKKKAPRGFDAASAFAWREARRKTSINMSRDGNTFVHRESDGSDKVRVHLCRKDDSG